MSPMTRATRPSTDSPSVTDAGLQSLFGAERVPSKPKMRKAPQRVGKSASATFFTPSSAMHLFYFARATTSASCVTAWDETVWDAARKLLNDRSLTARNAWGSRMGAVQWWGDGKADSDYAACETGGGSLGGQRTGQIEQLPSAVFCGAPPASSNCRAAGLLSGAAHARCVGANDGSEFSGRRYFF